MHSHRFTRLGISHDRLCLPSLCIQVLGWLVRSSDLIAKKVALVCGTGAAYYSCCKDISHDPVSPTETTSLAVQRVGATLLRCSVLSWTSMVRDDLLVWPGSAGSQRQCRVGRIVCVTLVLAILAQINDLHLSRAFLPGTIFDAIAGTFVVLC